MTVMTMETRVLHPQMDPMPPRRKVAMTTRMMSLRLQLSYLPLKMTVMTMETSLSMTISQKLKGNNKPLRTPRRIMQLPLLPLTSLLRSSETMTTRATVLARMTVAMRAMTLQAAEGSQLELHQKKHVQIAKTERMTRIAAMSMRTTFQKDDLDCGDEVEDNFD